MNRNIIGQILFSGTMLAIIGFGQSAADLSTKTASVPTAQTRYSKLTINSAVFSGGKVYVKGELPMGLTVL